MEVYAFYLGAKAITNILKLELPYPKMRQVLWLRDKLKSECELYSQEETKLITKFCKKDETGRPIIRDKTVSFESQAQAEVFTKKIEELRSTLIDYDIAPIHITDAEIGNQPISGEDIENLAPFITFGGE